MSYLVMSHCSFFQLRDDLKHVLSLHLIRTLSYSTQATADNIKHSPAWLGWLLYIVARKATFIK